MFPQMQQLKMDANEQIWFQRQLEYIEKTLYNVQYPLLRAREVIPVSYEIPTGAETFTYRQYDKVGQAKIINAYGSDFNRVDIKGKEFTGNIKSLGDSYAYNVQEVRNAQLTGLNLEAGRAEAAQRAAMELENDIAFNGDAAYNLGGFLSNVNVPNASVAADGNLNSTLWVDKTPDQIIRDVSDAIQDMIGDTKRIESPNVLLLPPRQHAMISTMPRSSTSDTTILEFMLEKFKAVGIQAIEFLNELEGSGTGSTDQFVIYRRDPMKLKLMVPQDFESFPPQVQGLEFQIPCHMRTGGVVIYYPLSVSKRYGI